LSCAGRLLAIASDPASSAMLKIRLFIVLILNLTNLTPLLFNRLRCDLNTSAGIGPKIRSHPLAQNSKCRDTGPGNISAENQAILITAKK